MQTHNLVQGSPEWLAYRREHFNASDAPAMMNASPYKTRAALLRELSTGVSPEVTDSQQFLFDRGHKFEGASRGMAETILGEELYPVVGSLDKLSSSFDGLNMAETIDWEHKTLNNELRACFTRMLQIPEHRREGEAGRELPLHHRIQMEQQLHISGAEKCLFTASRWSDDGELLEASHCWYFPDAQLRAEILAGWEQFERDLAGYTAPPPAPAVAEGRAPNVLPALRIEIKGEVTASNLAEFKSTALAAIRGVNRHLATDQDFADAEAAVKWCADVESRLDAAKQHALSQTSTIDQLFRTIDEISAEARRVRLEVDKLVKTRKDGIREDVVREARAALQQHAAALAAECAPAALNLAGLGDFAGAIKGKRTVQTLREACDAELARARIALDNQARGIRGNLAAFRELAAGREVLFADLGMLAHKAPDDFAATVRQRIADADRAQERLIAEAKVREAEKARIEEHNRAVLASRAAAAAQPPAPAPVSAPTGILDRGESAAGKALINAMAPPPAPAPRADEPATLKLGTICERLAPVAITAAGLEALGIRHSATAGAARLYRESDFPRICAAIADRAQSAAARDWRVAA